VPAAPACAAAESPPFLPTPPFAGFLVVDRRFSAWRFRPENDALEEPDGGLDAALACDNL
jgi:hypothetical protein